MLQLCIQSFQANHHRYFTKHVQTILNFRELLPCDKVARVNNSGADPGRTTYSGVYGSVWASESL